MTLGTATLCGLALFAFVQSAGAQCRGDILAMPKEAASKGGRTSGLGRAPRKARWSSVSLRAFDAC